MEAYHTQDEELRGFDFSEVRSNLARTANVLEALHEEFGEEREGVVIIPGAE